MKNSEEILKYLKNESQQLEIPESIAPEQMHKRLKQHEAQKTADKKNRGFRPYQRVLAAAACICIVFGVTVVALQQRQTGNDVLQDEIAKENIISKDTVIAETADAGLDYPEITYEDIYASMQTTWEKESAWFAREMTEKTEEMLGEPAEDGATFESGVVESEKYMNAAADMAEQVGTTNVQTQGVDEGDIVKNDGRYLYQKIWTEIEGEKKPVIQIIDTKDGLTEVSKVDGFDSIEEFYVWEDVLVVIESKYLDSTTTARKGIIACYDVAYFENYYHEISFFDLTDRSQSKKMKTFTLQGNYASSRIADGYFYGFSRYYANPGGGEQDYDSYVPTLDGARLQPGKIYLPAESDGTSYLVLVSVDLRNPTEFVETTGIVSGGDMYYVSTENIYVADTNAAETKEGWTSDTTSLLRFSYGEGRFKLRAMGEVKGQLDNSFSMDEYEEHLRVVSTVREYEVKTIVDDRTGEIIGSEMTNERQTNALYVLDEELKIVGKIEGLAEDEQIYSARFMGDTGYFVTFRQTDPLFAVDLKDPANPKILSELKVSGFSEYLHAYGEGRLLGIGMEANEETGQQEGMKLSMFDISDTTNVQEIARLPLEKYNYSEALYNHRAVMISPAKNIIGFEAEGSDRGEYWKEYLVFSYENEAFVQKLKLDTKNTDGGYYSARGTYIGDTFYLLCGDGRVRSYDLNTGEQLESLGP